MPTKAFACICVTIFYTLYVSGLLAQRGGGDVQQPKNPGPKQKKIPFLPNKKLMTVMKFSRTNLLNCFVFCVDPDQDRHSVSLHLGSNCLQKAIGRRQNYQLACKEL